MTINLKTADLADRAEVAEKLPTFDVAEAAPTSIDDKRVKLWKHQLWRGAEDDEADGVEEHAGWPLKGFMEWTAHLVVTHEDITGSNVIVDDFAERGITITTDFEGDGDIKVEADAEIFGEKTVAFINVLERAATPREACFIPLSEGGDELEFKWETGTEKTYDVTITVRNYMPDAPQ